MHCERVRLPEPLVELWQPSPLDVAKSQRVLARLHDLPAVRACTSLTSSDVQKLKKKLNKHGELLHAPEKY